MTASPRIDVIEVRDVADLCRGSVFLATGGGGDPYVNQLLTEQALREFGPVRLARENGSLFARKFVPFVQIPGQEDPPAITGAISTEEWKSEVTKMAKAAEASKEEEKGKRSSGADPAVLLAS